MSVADAFAKLDENKDGYVTEAEITAVLSAKGIAFEADKISSAFAALDADKDGKLSLAEFEGVKNEPFVGQFKPLLDKVLA